MTNYKRFFAIQEAHERFMDEVKDDLRKVGERYMTIKNQEQSYSSERFPYGIDTIEQHGDSVYVSGLWTRRGCTDRESCNLPAALVFGSPEEREAIFAAMEQKNAEIVAAKAQAIEDRERSLLAALANKYS